MFPFTSRRSPILSTRGMVATSQPLAVAAGLEILSKGGNAADAAIATAAALNVTEPTSTGIGGDAFALYYDAQTSEVTALNASGRAPQALTLELLHSQFTHHASRFTIPDPYHPHTVTVPGACAGWCDLVERHGRLPLADVLAPAIRLAEEGFPVAPITAHYWARGAANQLAKAPNGRELTLEGRAPRAGEIFRNPGLARTFRLVAEGGKDAYYRGPIAEAIVRVLRDAGGVMSLDDLATHTSTWDTPLSTTYRGYRLWECPPNGQGLAALLALNLLEGFDLTEYTPLSPQRLHLMIEAMRLAFADTRWYVADPAFSLSPVSHLLSKDYADTRRKLIHPTRATLDQVHGTPTSSSDTVYLTVVDGAGNACSFINSNYMGFGTGIVPKGWGFTLQNRGHNFTLDPTHPNALAPRQTPDHTLIPAMITVDRLIGEWLIGDRETNQPINQSTAQLINQSNTQPVNPSTDQPVHQSTNHLFASYGVMGGFMQPQGHMQVAVGLIDDALDPQAALDRPRFCIDDGEAGGRVALEEGITFETLADLAGRGHTITPTTGYGRSLFGRGQVIVRGGVREAASGVLWGGSDPRADGCAMGL